MGIRIYNSFSRKKEEFQTLKPDEVRMYVCGITAYDRCHIGHARSAVVFDVVVRHLRERGYKVNFVRNFTDIDDKIINRANEEGITTLELSEREIKHFHEDMNKLYVMRADTEPKATEHIKEIIELIDKLIKNGCAYEAGGDVYFSVRSFPTYGALTRRDLDEMMSGARIKPGEHKKDPLDFALWKSSKPGEPFWESPWGKGRPGWHIECSAMSMKYLGKTLDIHAGGLDLIFPHHENERAQSEAATGKQFVKYWMHNGFVTISGEKMSKSLGNFVTIQEILKTHHPEALRLFLLSKHYRSPLDYSEDAVLESETALDRCYEALAEAERIAIKEIKKQRPLSQEAMEAVSILQNLGNRFNDSMDDDFNSAQAIGHMFDGVRALNRLRDICEKSPSSLCREPLMHGMETIKSCAKVLGILNEDPEAYQRKKNLALIKKLGIKEEDIINAINERAEARKTKNWEKADRIRAELEEKGITLLDGPEGTKWQVKTIYSAKN